MISISFNNGRTGWENCFKAIPLHRAQPVYLRRKTEMLLQIVYNHEDTILNLIHNAQYNIVSYLHVIILFITAKKDTILY